MSDDHDKLYRRGTKLIESYMVLADRRAAKSLVMTKHLKDGIACLNRVLRIAPKNWSALWIRGKAHQVLGDHRPARDSFAAAYAIKSAHPDVAREYVLELMEMKEFSKATLIAEKIAKHHRRNAGLWANLAVAQLLNREVSQAQKSVGISLALDPNDKITKELKRRIDQVANGTRRQPTSLQAFQRGD